MKNFIFAMCGFLMMSLVSLSVQASSVESPKCEYVNPSVDVGLPDIQFITLETAPADCVVLTMTDKEEYDKFCDRQLAVLLSGTRA